MKVHYISILLFALLLNILVYNQRNDKSTTHHTPKISTNRLLCECELYAPAKYDNDPQMKRVIQQFEDRTSQRFHEYDDRMVEKRKQCKDKCDKEIQKIILKDKLEKQMEEQLSTLETKIDTDDIPTCICEKSMADKVEKGCLRCGSVLGGGVMPGMGLIDGSLLGAISVLKPKALKAAIEAAKEAAIAAGKVAGDAYRKSKVIEALKTLGVKDICPKTFESILKINHYTEFTKFSGEFFAEYKQICVESSINGANCSTFNDIFGVVNPDTSNLIDNPINAISNTIKSFVGTTQEAAEAKATQVTLSKTPAFEKTYMGAVETAYSGYHTAIIASVVAIVVIVLIMVIIYKILRYRRKKKMKKKLQYIKLLEE
ncbi:rifin PIR protein, putative [Plasmodium reichenowi]|uniref:Rifin PIR protein, putative n=1 Tax=Plasmodium reichenowi TaxID=5854 RepID=A0A2P9D4U3_PLARE|nr:rifin PIR protein, putative [Plasmodium reichenowi]